MFTFLCNALLIISSRVVLFHLAIVLSVFLFIDSDYPFGILWPLCCLSFYLRILITHFGIFKLFFSLIGNLHISYFGSPSKRFVEVVYVIHKQVSFFPFLSFPILFDN